MIPLQNLSYETEFDLYQNKPVGGRQFHKNGFRRTKTRFDKEEKGSPKMAYCIRLQENEKEKKKQREIWSTTAAQTKVHSRD